MKDIIRFFTHGYYASYFMQLWWYVYIIVVSSSDAFLIVSLSLSNNNAPSSCEHACLLLFFFFSIELCSKLFYVMHFFSSFSSVTEVFHPLQIPPVLTLTMCRKIHFYWFSASFPYIIGVMLNMSSFQISFFDSFFHFINKYNEMRNECTPVP